MIHRSTTKTIHSLEYCTGLHPEIKKNYKAYGRPTEFGNKVWDTSLTLIDHLQGALNPPHKLNVLEIGCGWGILGVYLAKEHQCNVVCTDIDERVLPIAELHANINNVSIKTDQKSISDLTLDYLKDFDLIIGAEVCYSAEVSKQIIQLFKRAKKAKVSQFLIGDPGRPDFFDCYELSRQLFTTELIKLPGNKNGKIIYLMSSQL